MRRVSPTTYSEVLAKNIRAARTRAGLNQQELAARMQYLGFTAWRHQTVGNVERGTRRVTAEEVFGLALALRTTIADLMSARDQDGPIELPSGASIGAVSVERLAGRGFNDRSIMWEGNFAAVTRWARQPGTDPLDARDFFDQGPPWSDTPPDVSDGNG